MANTVAAMVEGRRRWLKDLKDRGEPVPFGRKRGGRNRSSEERDQARRDEEGKRAVRRVRHESRIGKRARKQADQQQRDEAAVLARRHQRFQARDPDWHDTDLLDVALEAIHAHGATKRDIADLKRAERTFIERLRDIRDPPGACAVERAFAKLTRIETALGGEGKKARLAALQDALEDWRKRRAVDGAIATLASTPVKPVDRFGLRRMMTSPGQRPMAPGKAVERDRAPTPALSQPAAQTALRNQITPENNQSVPEQSPCAPPDSFRDAIFPPCTVEMPKPRTAVPGLSAREVTELVVRAGRIAGSRLAGVPYEVDFQGRRIPPEPHSAAPWLRRS
jgi:hypothetical protein